MGEDRHAEGEKGKAHEEVDPEVRGVLEEVEEGVARLLEEDLVDAPDDHPDLEAEDDDAHEGAGTEVGLVKVVLDVTAVLREAEKQGELLKREKQAIAEFAVLFVHPDKFNMPERKV